MKNTFTYKEIAKFYFVEVDYLERRARTLEIPKKYKPRENGKGGHVRCFTISEVHLMVEKIQPAKEVIYVTRTIEIYESRMNYTTLEKL